MPQAVAAAVAAVASTFIQSQVIRFFVTLATSAILSSLLSKNSGPLAGQSSFAGIQQTARGSLEYRKYGYGEAVLGGAIFWNNTRGSDNEWLDYQIAYTDHFAEAVAFKVKDTWVPVADINWNPPTTQSGFGSGDGNVSTSDFVGASSATGMQISWYPGYEDQPANTLVTSQYAALDSSHRARGVFNALFSLQYNQQTERVWEDGAPTDFLLRARLRRVYNRRRYALNLDPTFQTSQLSVTTNRTKWFGDDDQTVNISDQFLLTGQTLTLTNNDNSGRNIYSERIPVNSSKLYTVRVTSQLLSGDRLSYFGVAFYDSNGDLINNTSTPVSDATGWAGIGTFHYFVNNQLLSGTETEYLITFGPGGTATIPSNAVSMAAIALLARTGTASTVIDVEDFAIHEATARHDINDDTTWEFSSNPQNCTTDYMTQFMSVDPDEEIDWESEIQASQDCDVLVDTPSGLQPRFSCNGVWVSDIEHERNLENLKNCYAARHVYTGGKWVFWAGVWDAPQVSWDNEALADGDVEVQGQTDRDNRYNVVTGFFVDPSRDWKPAEFYPQENPAYLVRDGGRELRFEVDFVFVTDEYQAQRCADRKLDQFDNMKTVILVMNEQGARAYPGLLATWTLEEFGFVNKDFRCIEWKPRADGMFEVTWQEDFESRYTDPLVGEYTTRNPQGLIVKGSPVVPAVTGLIASGREGAIALSFSPGPTSLYDVTQIWRATSNDRSTAILVAEVTGTTYLDTVGDTNNYFYWVRNRFGPDQFSDWFPVSSTAGVLGQASSASAVQYEYILPTQGTAIRNGTGTLTLQARQVSGGVDNLLSAGTIQLYVGTTLVSVANGFAAGSDGYTGVFDSGDINGDVVVELKDGPTGDIIDSESLVDIADGATGGDSVSGFIESDNGLAWTRAPNLGAWSPAQTTIDLDATFVQGGSEVSRVARRITLNTSNGTLTSSVIAHTAGDLNTSRVTVTVSGSTSTAITVEFSYSFGGEQSVVTQTVSTSQGGVDGLPGLSGQIMSSQDWDFNTSDFTMGEWRRIFGSAANMSMVASEPGPFGEYPLVLRIVGDGGNPGWFGAMGFDHDYAPNKSYVYYQWVRRIGSPTTGLYIGITATGAGSEVVDTLGGVPATNPYFISNIGSQLTTNKWYLAVGVVWPDGVVSSYQGFSGIYDPDNGERVVTGTEFRWNGQQSPSYVYRAGFFDSAAPAVPNTDGFEFTRPTGWVRDGSEPSIDAVLGAGAVGGIFRDIKFQRSNSQPATPTGDNPAGWFDSIPAGTEAIWQIVGTKNAQGALQGVWSTPNRVQSLNYRGAYSAVASYLLDDVVTFQERTYICTAATTGNAPSGTNAGNAFWDLLAGKGDPGDPPSSYNSTITISGTGPVNLRDLANADGYDGISDATVVFNLNAGTTITGNADGGDGIDTGSWPAGPTIDLTLNITGTVRGGGGAGGSGGGNFGLQGGNGNPGGDAVNCQEDIDIVVNSGGIVQGGGGGGGGGGGAQYTLGGDPNIDGAGGGGGGFPNGPGGAPGSGDIFVGIAGAPGTTGGGGAGGDAGGNAGDGGNGGGVAASGANGQAGQSVGGSNGSGGNLGVPGFAIRYNGNTVGVTNNGTITGTQG